MKGNTCSIHGGVGDWWSECQECLNWDDKALREDITYDFFAKVGRTYHLDSGDMSPEDTIAFDEILKRYIKNNGR